MELSKRVEQQLNCATCGWDEFCIKPPTMTTEQVEKELNLEEAPTKDPGEAQSFFMKHVLKTMLIAGKDTECRVCPQFAKTLKADRGLVDHIKQFMRSK